MLNFIQDVKFGAQFTKDFADSTENSTTAEGLMNLHNNEAGRRVGRHLVLSETAGILPKHDSVLIVVVENFNEYDMQMSRCFWILYNESMLESPVLISDSCRENWGKI